jgi:sugar porter (SP) family MFS transporter
MFRGRLIVTFQLSLVVGILLAFTVDYMLVDTGANNWRYMFISEIFPSILFLILLFFVEKSPRWLVQKDRIEEAKLVIEAIGPEEDAQNLIIQIQNTLSREAGYKTENLFKKGNFKFILLGIAVGLFSQFTGIAIVMYYATDIFRSAGFSTDSAIGQTVVLGLTNLIFTIIAMLLIDKIGRKRLLLTGMLGMSIFLGLFSYSFLGGNLGNMINLILLVGFVAFFASSMGAVVFVLFAEIFPNSIRSRGMAIGSFSNWIVNASITFIFPVFVAAFDKRIGIGYSFAFFSIMTFIGFWVFKKFLFETHNRSLENIEMGNKMI